MIPGQNHVQCGFYRLVANFSTWLNPIKLARYAGLMNTDCAVHTIACFHCEGTNNQPAFRNCMTVQVRTLNRADDQYYLLSEGIYLTNMEKHEKTAFCFLKTKGMCSSSCGIYSLDLMKDATETIY